MKVLAIDYGKKRVGIATGDTNFKIAFPRDVLINRGKELLINEIKTLCEELGISIIVVGRPLNMEENQPSNEILQEVEVFVDLLEKSLKNIKIVLFDERLSTFEGQGIMEEVKNIGEKKPLEDDAYAAQIILQDFLKRSEI